MDILVTVRRVDGEWRVWMGETPVSESLSRPEALDRRETIRDSIAAVALGAVAVEREQAARICVAQSCDVAAGKIRSGVKI